MNPTRWMRSSRSSMDTSAKDSNNQLLLRVSAHVALHWFYNRWNQFAPVAFNQKPPAFFPGGLSFNFGNQYRHADTRNKNQEPPRAARTRVGEDRQACVPLS